MDIALFQEQRLEEMNQIVGIVNPTSKDFTCTHDSNSNDMPISYTIKAGEGVMLKKYIADHISEKLCTEILARSKELVTDEMRAKTLKTIRLYE